MADKSQTYEFDFLQGIDETVVTDVAEGVITTSNNTCLTRVRGAVSKRPALDRELAMTGNTSNACSSLMAAPDGSLHAAFPSEAFRIVEGRAEKLTSSISITPDEPATAWSRCEITGAGSATTTLSSNSPAVCVDSEGLLWTLSISGTNFNQAALFVQVTDPDTGEVIVSNRKLRSLNTTNSFPYSLMGWCGIAPAHDYGVCIFTAETLGIFAQGAAINLNRTGVDLNPNPLLVYNPLESTSQPSLQMQYADVCADTRNNRMYLLTRHATSQTSAALHFISVYQTNVTAAEASVEITNVVSNNFLDRKSVV